LYFLTLFFFLLLTLFIDASTDRAIYRKTYENENKVALIIGNSNYTHFSPLKNTLHDAEDIQQILKNKGFDVLYLKDGDLESMESMVEKFAAKLRKGGVGFFYYAGHGLEVEGNNYLVPVSANISSKNKVKYKSLPVNMIIDEMEDSHNRLNIIVLDACRNDPFSRGGGGLGQINNAKGMYIAFATAPGKVASDGGSGRNGLFTKHLIKNISLNNLTLNDVFKKTRASVYTESHEKQLPWTSSSVIGDFYFQLDATPQTSISTSLPLPVGMSTSDREELARYRQRAHTKEKAELKEFRRQTRAEKRKKEQSEKVQKVDNTDMKKLLKTAKVYYYGSSTTVKDYKKAKEYFLRAANHHSTDAYRYLGTIYLFGHGTSVNKSKAKEWLQKGIGQGDIKAENIYNKYIQNQPIKKLSH